MCKNHSISLGFVQQEFPAGIHVCQIFGDDDERNDALVGFILKGLQDGERAACFSDGINFEEVKERLRDGGIDIDGALAKRDLTLSGTAKVYFEDGRFDPDRMLTRLKGFHRDAEDDGYKGARVIGEMMPDVVNTPGGDLLLEYEARVNILIKKHPITAVCQYDARAFDGAMLMDVLNAHPLMVVHGAVVRNPFFVEPDALSD